MKLTIPLVLSLLAASGSSLANPTQHFLVQDTNKYGILLSVLDSPDISKAEGLSRFIMDSFSASQREDLIVKLWEQQDVVDVMRMTGHGDGLDEERVVQVFGEESSRM